MPPPFIPPPPSGLPFNSDQWSPGLLHLIEEIFDDIGVFLGKPASAEWFSQQHTQGFVGLARYMITVELAGEIGYVCYLRQANRAFWFSRTAWQLFLLKISVVVTAKHAAVLVVDHIFNPAYRRDGATPWLSNWDLLSPFTPWSDHTPRQRIAAALADIPTAYLIYHTAHPHFARVRAIVSNTRTLLSWLNNIPSLNRTIGLGNSVAMQQLTNVPISEIWGANRAIVAEVLRVANAWKRAGLWGHPQMIAALRRFLVIDTGMVWHPRSIVFNS